jgi:predicted ribosomally synthesized peptide with SipW-like signal peptide
MKKIGLICMALVLALGALGVGYAAWTDKITIEGTVETGTVDLVIVDVSSTFVYKVLEAPDTGYGAETVVNHVWGSTDPSPPAGLTANPPTAWLIASAVAEDVSTTEVKKIEVTYTNIFPSIDFIADVLLHYEGSIPVKVNSAKIEITEGADWMGPLYIQPGPGPYPPGEPTGMWIIGWTSNVAGEKLEYVPNAEGLQMHFCHYYLVEFHIHLPQDNALQGKSGKFTADLEVVQWNEYPYTHPQ